MISQARPTVNSAKTEPQPPKQSRDRKEARPELHHSRDCDNLLHDAAGSGVQALKGPGLKPRVSTLGVQAIPRRIEPCKGDRGLSFHGLRGGLVPIMQSVGERASPAHQNAEQK